MQNVHPVIAQCLAPFAPPRLPRLDEEIWREVEMAEANDPRLLRALRDQQQSLKEYEG